MGNFSLLAGRRQFCASVKARPGGDFGNCKCCFCASSCHSSGVWGTSLPAVLCLPLQPTGIGTQYVRLACCIHCRGVWGRKGEDLLFCWDRSLAEGSHAQSRERLPSSRHSAHCTIVKQELSFHHPGLWPQWQRNGHWFIVDYKSLLHSPPASSLLNLNCHLSEQLKPVTGNGSWHSKACKQTCCLFCRAANAGLVKGVCSNKAGWLRNSSPTFKAS